MADKRKTNSEKKQKSQAATLKEVICRLGRYRIFLVFSILLATVSVSDLLGTSQLQSVRNYTESGCSERCSDQWGIFLGYTCHAESKRTPSYDQQWFSGNVYRTERNRNDLLSVQ